MLFTIHCLDKAGSAEVRKLAERSQAAASEITQLSRSSTAVAERAGELLGRLVPGASIGLHTHEAGSEIVYILSGEGKALYDGGQETLTAGDCHYCPKGHSHSLINGGGEDLVFFAVIPQQ